MENNEKIKNGLEDLFLVEDLGEVGNLQLPTPELVQKYKNLRDRVIWIDKDIDDTLYNEIRLILQYNKEDEENNIPVEKRTPIKLLINSYGGNLDSMFAMVDVMNLSKTKIETFVMNNALSAAAIIYINGHERYAMPNSVVLLHSRSGGSVGEYSQVLAQTENYKKLMDMLKANILAHTKIDKKTLDRQMKKEWYLYLEDQIKWGVTTAQITDISQLIG